MVVPGIVIYSWSLLENLFFYFLMVVPDVNIKLDTIYVILDTLTIFFYDDFLGVEIGV